MMKYKGKRNLAEINKDISLRLLDSVCILEILEDMFDGERKESFLIDTAKKNLRKAFEDIEKCRKIISIVN